MSCVRAICAVAAWQFFEADDALACGLCIDRAVRGVTWWLWPMLASLGLILFLEVPGFWVASRLSALPVLYRRWTAMLLGAVIGLGLAILTAGSIAAILLTFAIIMTTALFRSLRAERDRRRSWTLTRLALIGAVPLLAAVAGYPGFRTTESLLDASLDVRLGEFSVSAGWPALELARRPDGVATIEKRFELYRRDPSQSFELAILVLLHYELGGPLETRRAWCEGEKLNDTYLPDIWTEELKKACPPAPESSRNQPMPPAGSTGG